MHESARLEDKADTPQPGTLLLTAGAFKEDGGSRPLGGRAILVHPAERRSRVLLVPHRRRRAGVVPGRTKAPTRRGRREAGPPPGCFHTRP